MKKKRNILAFVVIIVLVGVAFGYLAVRHQQAIGEYVKECTSLQYTTARFLTALQSRELNGCKDLIGIYEPRCNALIQSDPSLCGKDDFDCVAIASKNVSLCVEETCRAWVTKNLSECDSLGDGAEWCKKLISLDAQYFTPKEDVCKANAETATPWLPNLALS